MRRSSFVLALFSATVLCLTQTLVQAQGAATAAKPAAPAAAGAARTVEIQATDAMKFSVANIDAKPGESIRVVLKAVGTMPKMAMSHNFVLLKEGANAQKFSEGAVMAAATAYIPADQKALVLANTKVIGAGETDEVTFKAPTKAGVSTFLCSFPGHFGAGMKGTLTVK